MDVDATAAEGAAKSRERTRSSKRKAAAVEEGDSAGLERNAAGAREAQRTSPTEAPRTFLRFGGGGLDALVAAAAAEERATEEREKRARVQEAPAAPARKEDREVGKVYRVKVRLSDNDELRVWRGTKSHAWGCEHGHVRSTCKECGGGSICGHGRIRSRCKQCGGGSICAHGRQRNRCKECDGASICEHNRHRAYCKECGGSQICEHGKIRNRGRCEHGC